MSSTVVGQQNLALLSNASATGAWFDWAGGVGTFSAESANWNGGGCKLQMAGPNGSAIDVDQGGTTYVTLAANGGGNFELGPCKIRAAITGAPTGVYARVASAQRQ